MCWAVSDLGVTSFLVLVAINETDRGCRKHGCRDNLPKLQAEIIEISGVHTDSCPRSENMWWACASGPAMMTYIHQGSAVTPVRPR